MKFRRFSKKIDFDISSLGFGLMRLPINKDQTVNIDEAIQIVRHAIDNGVNFLDTAYFYHDGESEILLSKILKDGYREKVKISDKLPLWLVNEEKDLDRIFFNQINKLQVKKIDFYLLHALKDGCIKQIQKYDVINWLEKKRESGYIDYIGFSFHDNLNCFKKIVDFYNWDFCFVQFNIIDKYNQPGITGIKYAYQKGMGIIIMEPLRGGQLIDSIPLEIKMLWNEIANGLGEKETNPVKYMLDWIWNYNEVSCIISGMSNFHQVKENIKFANQATSNKLNKNILKFYTKIRKAYLSKKLIACSKCNYCIICPKNISIPFIFKQLNDVIRYENQKIPKFKYNLLSSDKRANNCINCGVCIKICPQQIDIPTLLTRCSQVFDDY